LRFLRDARFCGSAAQTALLFGVQAQTALPPDLMIDRRGHHDRRRSSSYCLIRRDEPNGASTEAMPGRLD
jgi:hypothetical protein